MRILIDTHLALWFLDGSDRMPVRARELVEDPANDVFVSDASVWEVAIKHAKRPDVMPRPCTDFIDLCDQVGFAALPVSRSAIVAYEGLDTSRAEGIHRDPFDRMLVAQAKSERLLLLTHDRSMSLYGEPLVSVV
jgi:PIN domain nuclease of toxin-antitoxin system